MRIQFSAATLPLYQKAAAELHGEGYEEASAHRIRPNVIHERWLSRRGGLPVVLEICEGAAPEVTRYNAVSQTPPEQYRTA